MQFCLKIDPFGRAFLNEVGCLCHILGTRHEPYSIYRGAGKKSDPLQCGPSVVEGLAQSSFSTLGRIPRHHVEPPGKRAGDPTRADYPSAQHTQNVNLTHELSLFWLSIVAQ